MSGAEFGLLLSILVALASTYEAVAISTKLPTISRVIQGWRDDGGFKVVFALVVFLAIVLGVFVAWLVRHLIYEKRSDL